MICVPPYELYIQQNKVIAVWESGASGFLSRVSHRFLI